ncbi:MAG: hypothetical protein AAFR39_00545 [Pseudomonadota bacterium]
MKRKLKVAVLAICSMLPLSVALIATGNSREIHNCVAKAPSGNGGQVGFELIDIAHWQAWVTLDWTLHEYEKFSPGLLALNIIKNDPRKGFASSMEVIKSPGCEADGEFSYTEAFGRRFFHIADIVKRSKPADDAGLITEARVEKYHQLNFSAGSVISVLLAPNGDQFFGVNEVVRDLFVAPKIPEGWTLYDHIPTESITIDLSGQVRVLRLSNGSSYQAVFQGGPDA